MKGVLKRKIWKTVAIVLGAIFAFVGGTVGVMAIAGKFKTPIVYPTVLKFEVTEQVIIETKPYNSEIPWDKQSPTIYSFKLIGTDPNSEHEVNQTDCYVWFKNDGESSKLITLCNKNGKPLSTDKSGRFSVDCNQPIYYMVNAMAEDATTNGRVELEARSVNDTLKKPDKSMVIWIDRCVENVFVDGWGETSIVNKVNSQSISLGVDIGFDFKYVVDAVDADDSLSLKPISKEAAKEIELYYVATGYSTDYLRVTQQEINNTNSPLNKILTYSDGVYRFTSSTAGSHTFIIAAFPTYKAKTDYEAMVAGETLLNPNFDRTNHMVLTTLSVDVQDIEISQAGFLGNNVVLNLYSPNDYITLNGTSNVEGAKENNLKLYMKKGVPGSQIDDYTRFDEVNMNGFEGEVWSSKKPMFSAQTASGVEEWIYEGALSTMSYDLTNIKLNEDLTVINFLYRNDDADKDEPYYCVNGVAVWNSRTSTIKLLKPGSYLNFYVQASNGDYSIANFDYQANSIGSGQNKSWNIISKEMPKLEDGEKLCIGILVVNNSGEFVINNYFDTVPVILSPVDIDYEILTTKSTFEITFEDSSEDCDGIIYSSKAFEEFVNIKSGSYNAGVLMVEMTEDLIIDTVSTIKYITGEGASQKTYVLVGYIDEKTGEFKNVVRVNENVTKDNTTCKIYMLQLKNNYNQSTADVVNAVLDSIEAGSLTEKIVTEDEVVKLFVEKPITINATYTLNEDLLTYEFYDTYGVEGKENVLTPKEESGVYTVYENTNNHIIVIRSTNAHMWKLITDFYLVDGTFFTVDYENLRIDETIVIKETGELEVKYNASNRLNDTNTVISLTLENVGKDIDLAGIKVLSGSPDDIVLHVKSSDGANDYKVKLFNTSEDALGAESDYLTVSVGYETSFTYTFKLYNKEILTLTSNDKDKIVNIFNENISSPTEDGMAIGFQDMADKGQKLEVIYDCLDKSIFNTEKLYDAVNIVAKRGETALLVKIGDTTKYLKIVTDTSAFTVTTEDDQTTFARSQNPIYLSDEFVKLTYKNAEGEDVNLPLTASNMVYITDVKSVSYGAGNLNSYYDEDKAVWTLKENESATPVLTIANNEEKGWTFTKANAYIPLTISFNVETIADYQKSTEEHNNVFIQQLTFESSITVALTESWKDERTLYAGTTVQLQGTDYSIFSVNKEAGVTGTIEFATSYMNIETEIAGDTLLVNDGLIGNISIIALLNDVKVAEFGFEVLPNILMEYKQDHELLSETSYGLDSIYDLSAYKTTEGPSAYVYGSSQTALYSNDANKTGSIPSLNVYYTDTISNLNPVISWDGSELSIGAMIEAELVVKREITIRYQTAAGIEHELATNKVNIRNCNRVSTANTGENEQLVYKALKPDYEAFALISGYELKVITDGDLSYEITDGNVEFTVTDDTLKFVVEEGNFTITSTVVEKLTDVDVILAYVKDTQVVTYRTKITIEPYTPYERETRVEAFSGARYDFLNGVFNANDEVGINYIVSDSNIKKLFVTSIKDKSGNNIAPDFISGGYTRGSDEPKCVATINEISEPSIEIVVEYTITYNDDKTYTFPVNLIVNNRQTISVTSPEKDTDLDNALFYFYEDYQKDAVKLSGSAVSEDNLYYLNNINYESVMIYTDATTSINFENDTVKKVVRAKVDNVAPNANIPEGTNVVKDVNFTIIAYQTTTGMADYCENKVSFNKNEIVLGSASQGFFGVIVFKLETVSGNYDYYYIYVFSKGSAAEVNANNNLEIVAYSGSADFYVDYTADNVVHVRIDENTDFITLISTLDVSSYYNAFKVQYNKYLPNLYLYDVQLNGGEEFDYKFGGETSKQYFKISTEKIPLSETFNTVTVGLVYDNGVEKYCYGTITIYVQSTNNIETQKLNQFIVEDKVEAQTTWGYDKPNGNFFADVKADAKKIECPFVGSGWEASIVSVTVDGVAVSHQVSTNVDEIGLGERVEKDTLILAKYTYNNTVVYVYYTLKATVVPNQKDIVAVTTGTFEKDKGFNSTVEIQNGTNYNQYFFGTYKDEYTLTVEGKALADGESVNIVGGGNVKFEGGKLTFKQTTAQQTIKVVITYTKLKAENNSREFTFIVLKGVHFDDYTNESQSGSGLVDTNVKLTTLNDADDAYLTPKGSKLDFYHDDTNGYYEYSVGGLIIYTVDASELNLTFDVNDYVLNDSAVLQAGQSLEITGTGSVYFVHSAQEKNVIMTISVNTADGKLYETRNLYIKVIPTYSTLKPVYLVDGAEYENVESGKTIGLIGDILLASNRIKLLDTEFNPVTKAYNLRAMGFAVEGNPNYVEYTTEANATIRSGMITFNTVTIQNTMCGIYLNNNAGIQTNSVVYYYQIMVGATADGVDLSNTTGHYDTYGSPIKEYVSFMLDDTGTTYTSQKFVLGTMKDKKNKGLFSIPTAKIKEEGGEDKTLSINKSTTLVGEYDEDAVQYQLANATYSGYKFYVTYDVNSINKNVELIVVRERTATKKNFILTLNAGGVNGGSSLISNLEIYLSNNTIEEKYATKLDTTIYSNYLIKLFEDNNDEDTLLNNGKFIENGGAEPKLKYVMTDSSYKIKGHEYNLTKDDTNNELFKYNQEQRTIQTNAVGDDVEAEIKFIVMSGNYVLKTVTYRFYIYLNMQIVVNGEALSDNIGNVSPETKLVLTSETDFPIERPFMRKTDFKSANKSGEYYNILIYELYRLNLQGNASPAEDELLMYNTGVVIEEKSLPNDCYTVTQTGITFHKDFTGEIELKLSVKTDNGEYYVIWTISVTGLITLTSVNPSETTRIENNNLPFTSNSVVDIINPNTASGTGIVISTASNFTTSDQYRTKSAQAEVATGENVYGYYLKGEDGSGNAIYTLMTNINATKADNSEIYYMGRKISYKYNINIANEETDEMTNVELFNLNNAELTKGRGEGSTMNITNTFSVVLPNVPSTSTQVQQSYWVTYRIYMEYLGLNYDASKEDYEQLVKVFYVTYNVINYQTVQAYQIAETSKWSTDVDVDASVQVDSTSTPNKYYLDLFKYESTFTTDSASYRFAYTNNTVKMFVTTADGTKLYNHNPDKNTSLMRYFENGEDEFAFNVSTRALFRKDGSIIEGTWSISKHNEGTYNSVFSANYTNIFEYKDFIDTYLNKESVLITETGKTAISYQLVEIEDGRYGIDLAENLTAGAKLFDNDMNAELALVDGGVKTVTIDAYSAANTAGFRLYTNKAIIPTTNSGLGVRLSTMFLPSYFESDKGLTMSDSVIGVGDPKVDWIKDTSGVNIETVYADTYAKISIPNGVGYNEYLVKKVKYKKDGGSALYNLEKEFYYINKEVVVPDYNAVGIETTFFKITYNVIDEMVTMDLTNAVKIWKMSAENVLNKEKSTTITNVVIENNGATPPEKDLTNKKIYMLKETLDTYKLNNPTKKNYPTFTAKITAEGVTLLCEIEFALPVSPVYSVDYSSGSTEDLVVQITAEAANNLTTVVEKGSVGYMKTYANGVISLDATKVNNYFTNNPKEKKLTIVYTTSTTSGSVDISIVINKVD